MGIGCVALRLPLANGLHRDVVMDEQSCRPEIRGAGEGNRTLAIGLEG